MIDRISAQVLALSIVSARALLSCALLASGGACPAFPAGSVRDVTTTVPFKPVEAFGCAMGDALLPGTSGVARMFCVLASDGGASSGGARGAVLRVDPASGAPDGFFTAGAGAAAPATLFGAPLFVQGARGEGLNTLVVQASDGAVLALDADKLDAGPFATFAPAMDAPASAYPGLAGDGALALLGWRSGALALLLLDGALAPLAGGARRPPLSGAAVFGVVVASLAVVVAAAVWWWVGWDRAAARARAAGNLVVDWGRPAFEWLLRLVARKPAPHNDPDEGSSLRQNAR